MLSKKHIHKRNRYSKCFLWYLCKFYGHWAGFIWCACTIHISKSLLVFKDYGYQLTTTKESNIRDVDVAPEYMDFLKEYYKYWKSQKN